MTQSLLDADALAQFADSVDRFVEQRYGFETHRRIAASSAGHSAEIWSEIAALGWTSLLVPAEHDGLGGGAAECAIVMEGIGRGLMLEPYLSAIVMAGTVISRCDEATRTQLLPSIVGGSRQLALAVEDTESPARCRRTETGWVVDGAKTRVVNGGSADGLIMTALADDGLALLLVRGDATGVERRCFSLIDSREIAEIRFDGAKAERLVCSDVAGTIDHTMDHARAATCAEAVGAMAALVDQTVKFAKTREQFGKTIGSFQAIQHRLVDMTIALQQARAIMRAANAGLDSGNPHASSLVSAASHFCQQAGRFVGEQAIQLHGGIGMTSELAAGAYFKRLLAIASLFGDSEWHLDRIAAGMGGQ